MYFSPDWFSSSRTQDFERDVGLAQADGVQRSTDLTAVLPGVLLGHPLQGHCGPVNGRSALKGTCMKGQMVQEEETSFLAAG